MRAQYAAADDAPGGVLIAMVVVIAAVLLGVIALRRSAPGHGRS